MRIPEWLVHGRLVATGVRQIPHWRRWVAIVAGILAIFPSQSLIKDFRNSIHEPPTMRVGISSWPGFAVGLFANGGMHSTRKSMFEGLKVDFQVIENPRDWVDRFRRGQVDLIW